MNRDSIETAYSFFHQKQRIYQYSTLDWQKEDIEYAIGNYVDQMDADLYAHLSRGDAGYLHQHTTFAADILDAVEKLENML